MRFVKISDKQPVVDYLVNILTSHLEKNETVLWLVSGGSAIEVAAETSKRLQDHDLSRLHVTLTDERYGDAGHPDSNWKQLTDAGFDLPRAELTPVLAGADRLETTKSFARYLREQLDAADFKIGLFGIGSDGHTAGILPHSPAVKSRDYAADYDANFQRITMTPRAIERLDEAVVYAADASKRPVLDALEGHQPMEVQPAHVLKRVPSLTIFNDYRGGVL